MQDTIDNIVFLASLGGSYASPDGRLKVRPASGVRTGFWEIQYQPDGQDTVVHGTDVEQDDPKSLRVTLDLILALGGAMPPDDSEPGGYAFWNITGMDYDIPQW